MSAKVIALFKRPHLGKWFNTRVFMFIMLGVSLGWCVTYAWKHVSKTDVSTSTMTITNVAGGRLVECHNGKGPCSVAVPQDYGQAQVWSIGANESTVFYSTNFEQPSIWSAWFVPFLPALVILLLFCVYLIKDSLRNFMTYVNNQKKIDKYIKYDPDLKKLKDEHRWAS